MKKYSFTITVEEVISNTSFIDGILSEIDTEKAQLDLTYKINEATSGVLKNVLDDFLHPINAELRKVGLEFSDYNNTSGPERNKMKTHMYKLMLPNTHLSYVIAIVGVPNRKFKESKYITFTGDYKIKLGLNGSKDYTACQMDNLREISNADEVFSQIRDRVKKEILASK